MNYFVLLCGSIHIGHDSLHSGDVCPVFEPSVDISCRHYSGMCVGACVFPVYVAGVMTSMK